jgi:hypothetical protein
MRICPKCNTECKEGEGLCPHCGNPLIAEEGHVPIHEGKTGMMGGEGDKEAAEEAPAKRFVCPKCKIIYERGDACIRCGSPVVEQGRSAKGEELPSPALDKTEKEKPQISIVPEAEKEVPKATGGQKAEKKSSQKPVSIQHSLDRMARDKTRDVTPSRNEGKKLLRLSREAVSIAILVGTAGYLFWSIYSHFIVKRPEARTSVSKEMSTLVPPRRSEPVGSAGPVAESLETKNKEAPESQSISREATATVPPAASPAPSTSGADIPGVESLRNVLENIQQGNLRKNINLFMSCYSPAFKGRERKKKETLETWEDYDYLSLSYDLKNPFISDTTARARVEWLIRFVPKTGGRTQESQTTLDVTFKKEGDGWKIIEVKPAS